MKQILVSSIFIILSIFTSLGQPRVDNPSPKPRVLKTSVAIKANPYIIGWAYNEKEGKWSGYYGNIDEWNLTGKVKAQSAEMLSINHGIVSLQTKLIEFEKDTVVAFITTIWDGSYKYPYIKEGYSYYQSTQIAVVPKKDFEKTFDMEDESIIPLPVLYYTPWPIVNQGCSVQSRLESAFKNKSEDKDKRYFFIKKENENTIRFLRPASWYATSKDPYKMLSNQYYEMNFTNWKKMKL